MSKARSYSTAAGEHMVLGQLLRKGANAYLAQGPTQKGWDIILIQNHKPRTVQVKTISWPKEKAVDGNLTSGFDFLVAVLLDKKNPHPRYLIFKADEVKKHLSKANPKRKDKRKRTLTVSSKKLKEGGTLTDYENNWKVML
jgi:hypothetical protein